MLTHSAAVNHGGGLRKEQERIYANPIHHGHAMGMEPARGTLVAVQLAYQTFSTRHTFGDTPPLADIPAFDAMVAISPSGKLVMLVHRSADGGSIELAVDLKGSAAQNNAEIVSLVGKRPDPIKTDKIFRRKSSRVTRAQRYETECT